MNSNTRIRFSTLYANARTVLDLILLNLLRQPRSHLPRQVSEKKEEGETGFGARRGESLFSLKYYVSSAEELHITSRWASESTVTRVRGSHIHAVKAAPCLLMNSSSVVGGRPPIFSTRSFFPSTIPF